MVSMRLIAETLTAFSISYRTDMPPEEITAIAKIWHGLFEDEEITENEFILACRRVQKVSSFFPSPANVFESHKWICDNYKPQKKLAIGVETHSPEEKAKVSQLIKETMERFSRTGRYS